MEHGRGHVAQGGAGAGDDLGGAAHIDERHQIGGVRRVRLFLHLFRDEGAHLLGVAMVGGDEHLAAHLGGVAHDPAQALVHSLHGLDRGIEVAGVSHHVGVGEIADDHIVAVLRHGGQQAVGDLRRAHLWTFVVGGHPGRRHQDPRLVFEHALLAPVEEEGHMRVFLGLRNAQLFQAQIRNMLPEHIFQARGGEQRRDPEVRLVFGHADERGQGRRPAPGKPVEVLPREGLGQLPGPVGAVVGEDRHIPRLHPDGRAIRLRDAGGLDEFIRLAAGVGHVNGDKSVVGLEFGLGVGDQLVGLPRPLPVAVAVHGVIAAHYAGEAALAQFPHLQLRVAQVFLGAGGRRVPAVQEGVQVDLLHIVAGGGFQQGEEVLLVVVHPARGQQPHDVDRPAALRRFGQGLVEDAVAGKGPILYGPGDAGELLIHHAPRADVDMAHFRVAHLLRGQSHIQSGGVQQDPRALLPELVPHRLPSAVDRVIDGVFRVAPAIQDEQDNRAMR